ASLRFTIVTAGVVAGATYLYPEGLIIYAAALFPLVGALTLWRMIRFRRFDLRAWLPLTSIAGVATSLLYPPLTDFLIRQVTWGTSAKVPWWEFFQAFFQGRDASWGSGVAQKIDFAAGVSGLYFATPTDDAPVAIAQRVAIVVTIVALLAALA